MLCTSGCQRLFGCVGLRKQRNCIFNKAYAAHDYDLLVGRIKAHMVETGEWGEFFPITFSPYAYNETEAHFHFPLTREQALSKGFKWKENDAREYQAQTIRLPLRIEEVQDSVVHETLACKSCQKNYRIVSQELLFYRREGLPIPEHCQECRHRTRMKRRNELRLWDRTCFSCGESLKTSYTPSQPELIYCESCYEQVVD